jgi:hypothetical protein
MGVRGGEQAGLPPPGIANLHAKAGHRTGQRRREKGDGCYEDVWKKETLRLPIRFLT